MKLFKETEDLIRGALRNNDERREAYKAGVIAGKALVAADLAAAEERGRREGREAGWKEAAVEMKRVQEEYITRLMAQDPAEWAMFKARQADRDALLAAKEAGDGREGKKEERE